MPESKITAAGQTTIPTVIRKHVALRTGDSLRYFLEGDRVLLAPARQSVMRLKGALPKPRKPVPLDKMEEGIQAGAGETLRG
jgi:bifunctional DNA-binding transcriptional regulator/antitoxin component of YhaV-PrlF toxin-antitoxin module